MKLQYVFCPGLKRSRATALFLPQLRLSYMANSWKGLKSQKHDADGLCLCVRVPVHARRVEMVIFRKQRGREESSRWSDRAQLPNEVSLVVLGVKKTLRSSPSLSQKGSSPKIYFTLYFYS